MADAASVSSSSGVSSASDDEDEMYPYYALLEQLLRRYGSTEFTELRNEVEVTLGRWTVQRLDETTFVARRRRLGQMPHPYDFAAVCWAQLIELIMGLTELPDLYERGLLHMLLAYAVMHRDVPVEEHEALRDWPRIAIQLLLERKTKTWQLPGGPPVDHDIDMCVTRLMLFEHDFCSSQDVVQMSWPHLKDLFSVVPVDFLYKPDDVNMPWGVSREVLRARAMMVEGAMVDAE
jgi:hypothetical protein